MEGIRVVSGSRFDSGGSMASARLDSDIRLELGIAMSEKGMVPAWIWAAMNDCQRVELGAEGGELPQEALEQASLRVVEVDRPVDRLVEREPALVHGHHDEVVDLALED